MSDWKTALREIDDDYLIGISNKGIVKRAYKDMETTSCKLLDSGQNEILDAIAVKVGEETVQIKIPLGESACSCPSRSICRHIILGILALQKIDETVDKEKANKETAGQDAATKETKKKTCNKIRQKPSEELENVEKECEESEEADKTDKSQQEKGLKKVESNEASKEVNVVDRFKEVGEVNERRQSYDNFQKSDNIMTKKVLLQITDYPLEKLCKSLGVRRLQELIDRARAGKRPQINYSSVVTVQPLAQAMAVKLLFPLECSTCTCHKKEFCVHKAEAVLWCKLESGQINVDELEQDRGDSTVYDMEQIQEVVSKMKAFLGELLDTGLTRTPQDALDHMERLAMICHNAKLPNFESDWRRMQDSYNKYLKRVASLRIQLLMRQITTFYRQVELLGQVQNALEVSKLAGAFRAEYTSSFDLDLTGIAIEHFVSKSGYEGETIYFLEENTKEWYTYTQTRPVFYENNTIVANNAGLRYTQETPWGLAVPLRELAFWHIHLEQAKCDSRRRLSSSKETKGQLIRDRRVDKNTLTTDVLGRWYYKNFAQLFEEQFRDKMDTLEKNNPSDSDYTTGTKLVFLRPVSCDQAVFLETEQKLCMNLYDEAGKVVIVEVVYSKDEAEGIRYLEKITNENLPCFFGKIYLRGGIIRMYPVSVLGKKELNTSDV